MVAIEVVHPLRKWHAKVAAAAAAVQQLLKREPVNASPLVMNTCYSFITP
jgi:hypothetical protein